jgi:Tol biopolymer transport system component
MPASGAGADDRLAVQLTEAEHEDWFPHLSPNGKQLVMISFPKGIKDHNGRMGGMMLRMMKPAGRNAKPSRPETVVIFFGGQGSLNVNSWAPDSQRLAYMEYVPAPPL